LGFDDISDYKRNDFWFGSIIGRCANRIAGASFELDGKTYKLDDNDNGNCLHSGRDGYSHRIWKAVVNDESKITFLLDSADGDQGFCGAAKIAVDYSLTEDNKIVIHYFAIADKTTIFNFTNHAYFNLNGHSDGFIGDHILQLDCDRWLPITVKSIPTGEIKNVAGTPFDFTKPKAIGKDIDQDYDQLKLASGYDHNFVINKPSLSVPFAKVYAPKTKISLEVFTDNCLGVQFYSGNFLGGRYVKRGGFCLETQAFPDAVHNEGFASVVYEAGRGFESRTVYGFEFPF
jgi:aldose 1-epimerase